MAPVVQTESLTRRFGSFTAVDGLNLNVEEGDLYGFLGPNGSGKTTSLRMILGLIRPSSGRVSLFGKDPREDFIGVMSRIGALVELPAYHPHLSAEDNLEVVRLASGATPASRIGEVLEAVGLGPRRADKVRTFSQGMRQRLGIAMALLARPRLVFLDEPTNGLDPQGVADMRRLIQELNRRDGTTFVISSHLLYEVEMTCTRIGMMKQGKMVLEDRMDRVLERSVTGLRVACGDAARGREAASKVPGVESVETASDGRIFVKCGSDRFAAVNAALVGAGLPVAELTPARRSLEEIFLTL